MQFISCLNASGRVTDKVLRFPINYYIGEGVSGGKPNHRALNEILRKKADIRMVHLLITQDVGKLYDINAPYFEFLKKLGRIGITIHCSNDYGSSLEKDLWFRNVLRIHWELPEAVLYIENCHNDLLQLINVVQALRNIDIEAYILIDTCHLEMDYANCVIGYKAPVKYFELFDQLKKYIGAYHISASHGAEGYIKSTHGKPIINKEDEAFFRKLCEDITRVEYDHDVFIIPEVTEESYEEGCPRINGKKALKIIKEYI